MEKRPQPDRDVLPAKVAERVLARASELEAVRSAGTGVADLRAAAAEAGISTESFDAALTELRDEAAVPAPVARERRRTRVWTILAGMAAMIIAAGTIVIPRMVVRAPVPATVEQTIELNCVTSSDAIDVMKPHLGQNGTVVASPINSRVLTVRGTPEEVKQAIAAVDKKGGACARY